MAIQLNHETPVDTELIGSRIGRIDPDIFENQSSDDEDEGTDDVPTDEPVDEDGDPTGKHDHQ